MARARARERAARARLEKLYLRGDEAVREGKQALGLWSQAGVDESRRTFKRAFESGKVFARRQTLWVRFFFFFFFPEREIKRRERASKRRHEGQKVLTLSLK